MNQPILLQDIAAGAHHAGREFGATIRADRVALCGVREAGRLPSGLHLHTLDAAAATDFETRILRAPAVVVHLILAGRAEAFIGRQPLRLARVEGAPVRMAFYALRHAAPFRRRARAGEALRKVSIDIGWEWLAARGVSQDMVLEARDFRHEDWPASAAEIAMAEEILALEGQGAACTLRREALVFGLVAGWLEHVLAGASALRPPEMERLRRIEDSALLPGPVPALAEIAAKAGLSLSSMQRLFQRAHGTSAKDRIRRLRLERAEAALRAGESVAQAAHVAGFVSVESFATAFKRHRGLCPSALICAGAGRSGQSPEARGAVQKAREEPPQTSGPAR
ncbi:helix-turn-helix transcriptional regulator [Rhodobacter lacus]|uniref:Helix-turn-helix transcriptional regulator n=1 Tax=Rhodobacter lacus TaxID=1641972 RepID=A0ABW5ADX7_9RHOB